MATQGFCSEATAEAFGRALKVVETAGDTPQTFPIWFFVWGAGHVAGDSASAAATSRRMIQAAERIGDPDDMMVAIRHLAVSLTMAGRHQEAVPHLERALELYVPARHEPMCARFGQEPGVSLRAYLAISLWCRRFPDQAGDAIAPVIPVSRRLGHTVSLAHALLHMAWVGTLRRDAATVLATCRELGELTVERGMPMWRVFGVRLLAIGHVEAGDDALAVRTFEAGAAMAAASESRLLQPYALAHRGLALARLGRHHAAAEAVAAAQAMIAGGLEPWCVPEVWRLAAWTLLLRPDGRRAAAERLLGEAVDHARGQTARSFELRAARDLARLWAEQGERQKALDLLAPIYCRFTEGFETPDLQEAKALLDELG